MGKGECWIEIEADIPEQVSVEFVSSGLKGGDAGHGGNATLNIKWEGGTYTVTACGIDHEENASEVSLCAWGDWEMHGLVDALIELGEKLKAVRAEME